MIKLYLENILHRCFISHFNFSLNYKNILGNNLYTSHRLFQLGQNVWSVSKYFRFEIALTKINLKKKVRSGGLGGHSIVSFLITVKKRFY